MSQLHTRAKCELVLQPLFWLWKTFPKVYWILLDLLASSISNLGFVSRTWRKNLTVHTKSIFRGVATLLNELDWAGIEPATIRFPGQTLYH